MSDAHLPAGDERPTIVVDDDADLGALIALAGLPSLTPRRFWSLVALGPPSEVWARVAAGRAPRSRRGNDAARRWPGWSSLIDPQIELDRHRRAGIQVWPFGHHGYPDALLDDPDPPVLVFRDGSSPLDDRVRIAVVGTRRCSRYGRDIAFHLGGSLARRGVDVVSGLAHGIDAAAHAGAAAADGARVVAVVAGGVDVVYPRGNVGLYRTAAANGALLSEWPLGSPPERWRFPARNRLVAALSAAVVVVESAERGGSMYTVDEALRRDRAVFAVPGSIKSPASSGTNRLIADGAHALCSIEELLDTIAPRPAQRTLFDADATDAEPAASLDGSWLLDTIGWEPMTLDAVVHESQRPPAEVTLEVERLIGRGVVRRVGGVLERLA